VVPLPEWIALAVAKVLDGDIDLNRYVANRRDR
jgi:hypothetical protein